MKIRQFFCGVAQGAAIGVSVIIPGVSGGTVAVLLNVYDGIIDAISSLGKQFKKSFLFLAPILLGVILAIAAMYFPLTFALEKAPLATVLLFAGLIVGSFPKLFKEGISRGFAKINIPSVIIPLAIVIGICFIPGMNDVDLSAEMPVYGYFLLVLVGAAASCALVVPGVSGSMLLLIFGYYNPVLATFAELGANFGHSVAVLALFALGLVLGFFTIARLMKLCLTKYPRGTYWAIIGFVIGSVPAIFITFDGNFPSHAFSTCGAAEIAVGVVLCVLGAIATFALTSYVEARAKRQLK